MNLITLTQGEPWMTPEEHDLNQAFVRATTDILAARGVSESPLITLRVNDVIVTWLLARRLESALTPPEGGPAPCPTLAQAGAIGKCRDRLRRAIKELEACCPRVTGASPRNPTDRMGEVLNPAPAPAPAPTPQDQSDNPPHTAECAIPADPGKTGSPKSLASERGTGVVPVHPSKPGARSRAAQPQARPHGRPSVFPPMVLAWKEPERPPPVWPGL